ncbi:hypothetical protein D3C87_1246020 [compost metagenome]|nr:hypothetical protein C8N37_105374 [Sphingobacterium faecium]GEM64333.1 hypothetical protein SF1_23150 [Sphingobacterium faecium NBRC 15299]
MIHNMDKNKKSLRESSDFPGFKVPLERGNQPKPKSKVKFIYYSYKTILQTNFKNI